MEDKDKELTGLLKEMLVSFNREAHLVPSKLEGEMCLALDQLGGKWLLAGLQAQGVNGAEDIEKSPDNAWKILRTEEGQKRLHEAIAVNKAGVRDMKRKVVNIIRTATPDDTGIVLKEEQPSNSGEIYRMVLTKK